MGSLAIALIYEDADTHRRATAVYEFLLQQVDEKAKVTASWWPTSLLGDPKLSKVAARSVGEADLVIMSIESQREPASPLRSWMESWPLQPNRQARLVALLDHDEDSGHTEWDAYLRDLTQRRNMIYLPGSTEAITGSHQRPPELHRIQVGAPGRMVTRYIEPYVHGGLNE